MDYDVGHYTDSELLEICGFEGQVPWQEATDTARDLSSRYSSTDAALSDFFENVKERFTSRIRREVSGGERRFETEDLEEAEAKARSESTDSSGSTLTGRAYDEEYQRSLKSAEEKALGRSPSVVQRRDQKDVLVTKDVPYLEGDLNPTYKTTTKRLLNVDSKNRSLSQGKHFPYPMQGCSTNYTISLSETLKNVQALTLYSYEIPTSWNSLDEFYGNNKLIIIPYVDFVTYNEGTSVTYKGQPLAVPGIYYVISVPSGSPGLSVINEYLSNPANWAVYSYFNNDQLGTGDNPDYRPTSRFHIGVMADGHLVIKCTCLPPCEGCPEPQSDCTGDCSYSLGRAELFDGPMLAAALAANGQQNWIIVSAKIKCCGGDAEEYSVPGVAPAAAGPSCSDYTTGKPVSELTSAAISFEALGFDPDDYTGCEILAITLAPPEGEAAQCETYDVYNSTLLIGDTARQSKYWTHCGYSIVFWDTATSTKRAPVVGDPVIVAALATANAALPAYLPSFQTTEAQTARIGNTGEMSSSKYQNSLGWMLGYREAVLPFGRVPGEGPNTLCATSGAPAPAWSVWAPPGFQVPITPIPPCPPPADGESEDLLAPWQLHDDLPYVYIVLKDFNKNVASKAVVNAMPLETVLDMPSYAQSVTGTLPTALAQSYTSVSEPFPLTVRPDNPVRGVVKDDLSDPYSTARGIYDTNDGLTKKQLFTLASIAASRKTRSNYSVPNATNSSDILARISTKTNNSNLKTQNDKWMVGFGSNLAVSERKYFGPVDISRLQVQLMDPYGNIINIHNRDWSFTLRVEHLYQF